MTQPHILTPAQDISQLTEDQLTAQLAPLADGLDQRHVRVGEVAARTLEGLHAGADWPAVEQLAAETAATLATAHPDYALLGGRIATAALHRRTTPSLAETASALYNYINPNTNEAAPLLADDVFEIIQANSERLQAAIDFSRDFVFDFFGYKTLERSYLLKLDGQIAERPQHMWMRVAIGIHKADIEAALETYRLLSEKWFIHATPTLFNAGTRMPQMSSCFLLRTKEDSITGIFETIHQCAEISKSAGGIGLSIHDVRAKGSYIKGTNGASNGLVPMLKVFNETARYVDQGGGKRKGAFAMYLEPWHADIFDFLELKKNHGKEEARARDLFYALWMPDLFMERVKADAEWPLFCPQEAPGLADVHSGEFRRLFEQYEAEGRARTTVKARKLWFTILEAQIETGTPYLLYKDHANAKSNQQNLGTIRSSNLCSEIIEYTSADEVAVCNLASIALNRFVDPETRTFDFDKLAEITAVVTRNLNKIIDLNDYPVPEAANSNLRHRPIGIGVQGLADAFLLMRLPFDSEEANELNWQIFETMYYAALATSCEIAKEKGAYESFEGSPLSRGELQFDLWGAEPSGRYDWAALRQELQEHGARNSLLLALMPTASTSQILGNNECFEPYTSNIYTRRVLSGEFIVVNKHLLKDLTARGLWDERMKNELVAANGSVQNIEGIPDDLKALYKTAYEVSQKAIINQAASRGPFVCQSQSMNLFVKQPNFKKLTSMHFYAWESGLKTGVYYLRSQAAANAIQFTVDKDSLGKSKSAEGAEAAGEEVCAMDDGCISCGS